MSEHQTVGGRVRALRLKNGLSQQELASADVSGSYISLIESGKRQPSQRALSQIADRLGTSVGYLATGVQDERRQCLQLTLAEAKLLLDDGDAAGARVKYQALTSAADPEVAQAARWGVARSLEAGGDLERAAEAYEELLAAAVQEPAAESFLAVTTALCRCYHQGGDLTRAVELGEAGLTRLRSYGLAVSDAAVDMMLTLAAAYLERGDLIRTRQLLTRIHAQVQELGTPRARGAAYWNAAVLASELGDAPEALRLAERAVGLFGEGDDERNLARLRNAYAGLLVRHDPQRAQEAFDVLISARDSLTRLGSAVDVAYCETEIARALVLLGRAAEAIETAIAALNRLEPGVRVEGARARAALAYALAATGDLDSARTEYLTAAAALESLGARRQAALIWLELADAEEARNAPEQAVLAVRRAHRAVGLVAPFPPQGISNATATRALNAAPLHG